MAVKTSGSWAGYRLAARWPVVAVAACVLCGRWRVTGERYIGRYDEGSAYDGVMLKPEGERSCKGHRGRAGVCVGRLRVCSGSH